MTIPVRIKGTSTRVSMDHALIEYYATLPEAKPMEEKPRHAVLKIAVVLAVTFLLCLVAAELMAMEEVYRAAARV